MKVIIAGCGYVGEPLRKLLVARGHDVKGLTLNGSESHTACDITSLPAVENDPGESLYKIPLPPAYGPPVESVAHPQEGVTVEYGEYLAGPVAHCIECHSPMGPMGPDWVNQLGAGGFEFHGPWGTSISANLTSHPEDGIAEWTDAELTQMIASGVRPNGTPMLPPMGYGYYSRMKPEDISAVILYLRQLPPLPDPG